MDFYKMRVEEIYLWIKNNNKVNGEIYWDDWPEDPDEELDYDVERYKDELESMAEELFYERNK